MKLMSIYGVNMFVVDFKNVFDNVNRHQLWEILE